MNGPEMNAFAPRIDSNEKDEHGFIGTMIVLPGANMKGIR